MVAFLGVVGERHAHHVEQGQNGEDGKARGGQEHQQLVHILVKEGLDGVHKGGNMLARLLHGQGLVAAADGGAPHHYEQRDDAQAGNAVQKDQLGLIAGNILIDKGFLVENLLLLPPAQAGEHGNPIESSVGDHQEGNHANLNGQKQQSHNELPRRDIGKAHDEAGCPHQGAAVFQGSSQAVGIGSLLP